MGLFYSPEYVFDSNVFIKMRDYPPDLFKSMWDKISEMLKQGRIISCSETYREVAAEIDKDDDASRFVKKHKSCFYKPTGQELVHVLEINKKFPYLVKPDITLGQKPDADPFIIAQAIVNNCAVIHHEKWKPNAHKIPNVCRHYKVREMNLLDFLREQGWVF